MQLPFSVIVTLGLLNTGVHACLLFSNPLGHIYGLPYWATMLVSLHISLRLLGALIQNMKLERIF
jgi:hypothetical protein